MTDDAQKILALAQAMEAAAPVLAHLAGWETGHAADPPEGLVLDGARTDDEVHDLARLICQLRAGEFHHPHEETCADSLYVARHVIEAGWRRDG